MSLPIVQRLGRLESNFIIQKLQALYRENTHPTHQPYPTNTLFSTAKSSSNPTFSSSFEKLTPCIFRLWIRYRYAAPYPPEQVHIS
jgi:hypothetical protein